MPTTEDFCLPDVGEGLTEADILQWTVALGDTVEVNQIIVEIETAKAAVELPSPYAGTVAALHAAEGDTVPVGAPLITIAVGGPGEPVEPDAVAGPAGSDQGDAGGRTALLVGYGPRDAGTARRRTARPAASTGAASASTGTVSASTGTVSRPSAKPPVRKLAKDLGVDLRTVLPTGPHGTISREDVHLAAGPPSPPPRESPSPGAGANSRGETRIPIRGVRKHMAAAMVASAFTAPHVTEFVTVDVSETMRLRELVGARREFAGMRISPMLFVAKALLLALRGTPELNSVWDESRQEIVLKHYINLGIAAATDRGLVVPNIKDADLLSLPELARAIAQLATTAREGRTEPRDLAGGTVTLTNVGVFGVDTGTPILNPGEAAILALGAVRRTPWVVHDQAGERIEPRWTAQLALSFDHRLADGRQGSRLLADVADLLREPGLAML
ncbi:2-oxo acid dehydrogenase subunit E2 [Streptomyces sp. BH-SS-21]|uniref:Dihydrolipoamide acetyltransferase component of pyruvate dehydrogenase complex n=1 Tax=Streptomyces liliiviolaceus TaxID=2823109 RepID=A0A941BEY9_9ACTN|nr:dihydrolipoamide acetyltransferase family protein [Streptomyces liliiviolaceus]MBQ0851099.1 2-oxo acid dehydrogenase subunit E2 [Streptomyces liliiviolaceus]